MARLRELILGIAAALVPAIALPFLASRSPLLQRIILWTAPVLPAVLLAIAFTAGAWDAVRSWRTRADPTPGETGPASGAGPWRALGPAAAVTAFLIPLLFAWSTAASDGYSAFGLLPWSDAGNYYRGALDLLETGRLDDWNCRRPLNAAILAVHLAILGKNLQGVQICQVVLLSLAAYALSRTIAKDLGRPAGLILFALLLAYSRPYLHWLSSEWLGLTLGALATALLWIGARERRMGALAWGMAVLTLALNARAGTFLVLPALVLWAGGACRKDGWL
jgi:hypothetical protein